MGSEFYVGEWKIAYIRKARYSYSYKFVTAKSKRIGTQQ
jgi:hypothetical protein